MTWRVDLVLTPLFCSVILQDARTMVHLQLSVRRMRSVLEECLSGHGHVHWKLRDGGRAQVTCRTGFI